MEGLLESPISERACPELDSGGEHKKGSNYLLIPNQMIKSFSASYH